MYVSYIFTDLDHFGIPVLTVSADYPDEYLQNVYFARQLITEDHLSKKNVSKFKSFSLWVHWSAVGG